MAASLFSHALLLPSTLPVSKTTRELLLEWSKDTPDPVDLSVDLRLPQFRVDKVVTEHCEDETNLIGE